ncbi:uncharacterized protein LOC117168164 [Belonocnema kinseyi]|uniref:uncharacterized protein LOC117168164 n=1 Tax=Belonocnema kinseyi TaxID=2817044 RepID=UPI00143D4F0C|nr:uncharacterized protein LOC117168164 [Belonocnema kinseyi]
MEVDSEKNTNNVNPGRVLRKRKKQALLANRVVKRRTNNVRATRSKRNRRHRSLDPPKKDKLSKDSHGLRPSTSNCSLNSVIYLGYYRKVPQLIIIDDNSDSIQNQGKDRGQLKFTEGQNESTSSPKDRDDVQSSDRVPNNSWNETKDTTNLLDLLNEMYVGAGYKRIATRARTRECKN